MMYLNYIEWKVDTIIRLGLSEQAESELLNVHLLATSKILFKLFC